MALVRQRAAKDLQVARLINQQMQDRGQQFGVAAGNIDPSAAAAMAAASRQQPQQQVVMRSAAPLKLRPDASAPDVEQLRPSEPVSVSPGRNGYALVETSSGARGYVSAADLQGQGRRSIGVPTTAPAAASGDMRTLAGSNAARRDDFAQSVAVTEKAEASGFQLAAGSHPARRPASPGQHRASLGPDSATNAVPAHRGRRPYRRCIASGS